MVAVALNNSSITALTDTHLRHHAWSSHRWFRFWSDCALSEADSASGRGKGRRCMLTRTCVQADLLGRKMVIFLADVIFIVGARQSYRILV